MHLTAVDCPRIKWSRPTFSSVFSNTWSSCQSSVDPFSPSPSSASCLSLQGEPQGLHNKTLNARLYLGFFQSAVGPNPAPRDYNKNWRYGRFLITPVLKVSLILAFTWKQRADICFLSFYGTFFTVQCLLMWAFLFLPSHREFFMISIGQLSTLSFSHNSV